MNLGERIMEGDLPSELGTLRPCFPVLVELRARTAMKRDCAIEDGWLVGPPTGRGGLSAQVPSPGRDGVWFDVGLYDPHGP